MWDNLSDADLRAMDGYALQVRIYLLAAVASDHKQKPDYPDIDRALTRAIDAYKLR